MKHNQKLFLSIGLGVVIILNVLLFGWLLTDFFSGPNGPEETVAATDSEEETIGEETMVGEEASLPEETTEEPPPEESTPEATIGGQIEVKIPFAEVEKNIIRTFGWGSGIEELGYHESVSQTRHPLDFAVMGNIICVDDHANERIVINYEKIDRGKSGTSGDRLKLDILDGWITIWNPWKYKLTIYRNDTEVEMVFDLSTVLKDHLEISGFLEIGSTYVVWSEPSGDKEAVYRYDWIENKVSLVTLQEKNIPAVSLEGSLSFIIGTYEEEIYYCQYGENSDRYILHCVTPNYHLRTEIEFALYRTVPLMYLSPDGHLYIMEMFEDGAKISEIRLEPQS